MSNRLKGCTITFEQSIREDDAREGILNAIRMIRGVASVTESVDDLSDQMNRERIKREMQMKIWEIVK